MLHCNTLSYCCRGVHDALFIKICENQIISKIFLSRYFHGYKTKLEKKSTDLWKSDYWEKKKEKGNFSSSEKVLFANTQKNAWGFWMSWQTDKKGELPWRKRTEEHVSKVNSNYIYIRIQKIWTPFHSKLILALNEKVFKFSLNLSAQYSDINEFMFKTYSSVHFNFSPL